MLHFHSKKHEFLEQEIYSNLILYNFGIFIANEAARRKRNTPSKRNSDNKYRYEIDISTALRLARKYLAHPVEKTFDILKLIVKYVHAVKEPYRSFSRPLRGIGSIRFGYR